MSKVIKIRISDSDYANLIFHMVNRRGGKPMVGVETVLDGPTHEAIGREVNASAVARTRTVTAQRAEYIANLRFDDAYSAERYGPIEWRASARFLARHGFTAEEIETILLSKWMRWAADAAVKATALSVRAYIKAMHGDEFREAAKMVREGK